MHFEVAVMPHLAGMRPSEFHGPDRGTLFLKLNYIGSSLLVLTPLRASEIVQACAF